MSTRAPQPPADEPRDRRLDAAYADAARDTEGPPTQLDDAIRAAARRAVQARPQPVTKRWTQRWSVPVALAATVMLAVGVILRMQQEAPHEFERLTQRSEAAPPAPQRPAAAPNENAETLTALRQLKQSQAESAAPGARADRAPPAGVTEGLPDRRTIPRQVEPPARVLEPAPTAQSTITAPPPPASGAAPPAPAMSPPPPAPAADALPATRPESSETMRQRSAPEPEDRRRALEERRAPAPAAAASTMRQATPDLLAGAQTPDEFVARVRELRDASRLADARAVARTLRERHPAFELPADVAELLAGNPPAR